MAFPGIQCGGNALRHPGKSIRQREGLRITADYILQMAEHLYDCKAGLKKVDTGREVLAWSIDYDFKKADRVPAGLILAVLG